MYLRFYYRLYGIVKIWSDLLESTFSAVPRELMKRLVSQKANKNPGAYPPELRGLAMTLKFYSTKAYNYVRDGIVQSTASQVSPRMR